MPDAEQGTFVGHPLALNQNYHIATTTNPPNFSKFHCVKEDSTLLPSQGGSRALK